MTTQIQESAVTSSIVVGATAERAFEVFTSESQSSDGPAELLLTKISTMSPFLIW